MRGVVTVTIQVPGTSTALDTNPGDDRSPAVGSVTVGTCSLISQRRQLMELSRSANTKPTALPSVVHNPTRGLSAGRQSDHDLMRLLPWTTALGFWEPATGAYLDFFLTQDLIGLTAIRGPTVDIPNLWLCCAPTSHKLYNITHINQILVP